MKNNRMGLLMIAATLAVIGLIVAAVYGYAGLAHERQIRAQGVSLSRSLSMLPFEQLAPGAGQRSVLDTAVGAQRSEGFAYALLVTPRGAPLVELTMPGTIVPAAAVPAEPSGWHGERILRMPDSGLRVLEFHSPVMAQGNLAGFVRLGYFADPPRAGVEQLSFAGMLALPIFLLAPFFYLLMRREIRPLSQLARRLDQVDAAAAGTAGTTDAAGAAGAAPSPPATADQLSDFVERFGRFLSVTEARMRELESAHLQTVASSRLIAYHKDKVEVVLQSLQEGILVIDDMGRASFANASLEGLIGVGPEQIVGQPPRQWCQVPALLAFLLKQRPRPGEALARAAQADIVVSGTPPRFLSLSAHPLSAPQDRGSALGTLIVIRDTTQEQLARTAGADFVMQVSHELKTPLASIVAYSELLMGDDGQDAGLRVEAVNVIHDEAERMAGLINNLLGIAKIDSGAMTIKRQRVNLHDLLTDAFESQRQGAVGRGLDFRLDVPPNLGAAALDKDLFRIALNNLLSNAIKYNQPGGFIALSAEEDGDQGLAIRIRDGGIGIPANQIERIFDKYYRVADQRPGAGERKGHGLGLHLVRQIIDLHQGSISVDSTPGRGSEFCIRVRKLAAVYEEAVAA
jgi:signal transduction histidine kinase